MAIDADSGDAHHPEFPDLRLERLVEKMSKSRGNVLNPDDVVRAHGADSMRLYEMFIGPLEKAAPWSTDGIMGIQRFLQRCWRLLLDDTSGEEELRKLVAGVGTQEQARLHARTIAGVSEDIENMRFNTAISKLMVFVRDISKDAPMSRGCAETLVLLLSPMAPHISEELWRRLGHGETLAYEPWPVADESLLVDDEITIVAQVNGKKRDELRVPRDASVEQIEALALASENVQKFLGQREPKRIIVVPQDLEAVRRAEATAKEAQDL